jgi:hypothetical protein
MRKGRCASCDKYEHTGHNYCRKCGFKFKPGFVKYLPIVRTHFLDEKFCGYCGKLRVGCKGAH